MKTVFNPNSTPLLKRFGKCLTVATVVAGSYLIGTTVGKGVAHAYNNADAKIDEIKDRIEVYEETKKEGLPYYSHDQAKAELGTLHLNRRCEDLGVDVPQKPATNATNATILEELRYNAKINSIYSQTCINEFNKIINNLQALNGYKQ